MQTSFGGVEAILDDVRGQGRVKMDALMTVTIPGHGEFNLEIQFLGGGDSDAFYWKKDGQDVILEDLVDQKTYENVMDTIEAVLDREI